MINRIINLMSFVLFISLVSCATGRLPSSASSSGPRTIIIDGETFSEKDAGGFTSWKCKDNINGGSVLVEVGFFGDPSLKGLGFILFDGGYSGEKANYRRAGLEHRWDWGPNENDYAFVIIKDGLGAYYDFSTAKSKKPNALYNCKQR